MVLSNGVHAIVNDGAGPVFHPDIILAENQVFSNNGSRAVTLGGTIHLSGYTLFVGGTGVLQFDGPFSGTGSLITLGTNTIVINSSSTRPDLIEMNAGELRVKV